LEYAESRLGYVRECKHADLNNPGNGADSVQAFGCYNVGHPTLSPEYMFLKEEHGIDVLHVDYRVYSLPTWQTLTGCEDLNTQNEPLKTECRANHNFRQSWAYALDDADDEWEGYTITWMAPDNDIFGPDNLVVRSGPDPATGHDYVAEFPGDNGSDMWHIYRIAVEVGPTPAESFCRIYLDENSEPVITTAEAKPDKGRPGNFVEFGVMGWNMPKVASMAWVLCTTEGAFGPDELPLPDDYMQIYNTARQNQATAVKPEIHRESAMIPDGYGLEQNFPNPFNPTTALRYRIKNTEKVTLTVFNSTGQFITCLVNKNHRPGVYRVHWDGTDLYGNKMPSGPYFAVLKTPSYSGTVKMVLVK